MAGFGVSISDFVSTGAFAWKVYRACKSASAEFEEVSREVISLHAAVKELEDEARKEHSLLKNSNDSKRQELALLVKNVKTVLSQLEKLVTKYQSLSTKHRKKWDIFKFGTEGLNEIRSKIVFHTSAINLFLASLGTESLGRIEKKLDDIVKELKRGDRDASSVAHLDEDVPEADDQWNALKEELLEDGFTKQDIEVHKEWIKSRLRELIDGLPLDYAASHADHNGTRLPVSSSDTTLLLRHDPPSSGISRRQSSIGQSRSMVELEVSTEAAPQHPQNPSGLPTSSKKTDQWTPDEDALIFRLRNAGMGWDDISNQLEGRRPMMCRARYQSCLGIDITWDREQKNKLARLYERSKPDMWFGISEKLRVPWQAAEAAHWNMGPEGLNAAASDPDSPFFSPLGLNPTFVPLQGYADVEDGNTALNSAPSLRSKRSSSSLATSVHSDITEYDGRGQVTKRTVTMTRTYSSASASKSDRRNSYPAASSVYVRRSSSPAPGYGDRGLSDTKAQQRRLDGQEYAAMRTGEARESVPLGYENRNLRERLMVMSRHLHHALRLLHKTGVSRRLLEIDEKAASRVLPFDASETGIFAQDVQPSGQMGPRAPLDHRTLRRELLTMEGRVDLLRIGPRLEMRLPDEFSKEGHRRHLLDLGKAR